MIEFAVNAQIKHFLHFITMMCESDVAENYPILRDRLVHSNRRLITVSIGNGS